MSGRESSLSNSFLIDIRNIYILARESIMFKFRSQIYVEVLEEFESYFSGLVGDVERNNEKYAAAMRQLEQLLQLEHETELIRRKVAAFTLDYDDDLVIIITNFVSICQFVLSLFVCFSSRIKYREMGG